MLRLGTLGVITRTFQIWFFCYCVLEVDCIVTFNMAVTKQQASISARFTAFLFNNFIIYFIVVLELLHNIIYAI